MSEIVKTKIDILIIFPCLVFNQSIITIVKNNIPESVIFFLFFFIFYKKCKNVLFLHHKTPTHTYNLEFNTVPSSSVLPTSAGGQTSSTFRNLPL